MQRWVTWFLAPTLMMCVSLFANAQNEDLDPRQLALDIYSGINRGTPEASIALSIRKVVELFRYRCTRVTDYQVFSLRPNITDLKVKCSGDPLYGITVASNGFVTVYGGNGILSGLDRRDAIIYSFGSEGEFAQDSSLTIDRALDDTAVRLELGDEYNYLYLFGLMMVIIGIAILGGVVWFRMWKKKTGRKPRQRMKPMHKHRVGLTTATKDQMLEDSVQVFKFVHKHSSGIFIATGKRGKRRLFASKLFAVLYAAFGIRLFEASVPKGLTVETPESDPQVD